MVLPRTSILLRCGVERKDEVLVTATPATRDYRIEYEAAEYVVCILLCHGANNNQVKSILMKSPQQILESGRPI